MNKETKQILENQMIIMEKLELTDRQAYNDTLNLVYSKVNLKEDCCEMPEEFANVSNSEDKEE